LGDFFPLLLIFGNRLNPYSPQTDKNQQHEKDSRYQGFSFFSLIPHSTPPKKQKNDTRTLHGYHKKEKLCTQKNAEDFFYFKNQKVSSARKRGGISHPKYHFFHFMAGLLTRFLPPEYVFPVFPVTFMYPVVRLTVVVPVPDLHRIPFSQDYVIHPVE
jgi:hypothetical protein